MVSTEVHRGSDCSGTDGTANRVLTLANTSLSVAGGFTVYANGLALVPTTEYTVVHLVNASQVTLLNNVWDVDYLVAVYLLSGASAGAGKYCSSTDVYNKTGLSSTEVASAVVDNLILDAEAELESTAGRLFTNGNVITEYLTVGQKDVVGNYSTSLQTRFYPLQSVSAFQILNADSSVIDSFPALTNVQVAAGTYSTTDYWLETGQDSITNAISPRGRITLVAATIMPGTNTVKITYTYGYDSVPQVIHNLAVCLTGIRVWLTFMGGSYNRINSYSIPEQSVQKGDFYTRANQNIEMLTSEAERLYDRIGKRMRTLFFSSGAAR